MICVLGETIRVIGCGQREFRKRPPLRLWALTRALLNTPIAGFVPTLCNLAGPCDLLHEASIMATRNEDGHKMKTSQQRILTTHVGSLPRPAELLTEHAASNGILRNAVAQIVKKQLEIGLDIIDDGE